MPVLPSLPLTTSPVTQINSLANAAASAMAMTQRSAQINGAAASTVVGGPRTRVYSCPLLSCGRLFKRMEHLKRHLRTHTMERPFICDFCNRRFSRADNLNAHIRTHSRDSAAGGSLMDQGSNGDLLDVDDEPYNTTLLDGTQLEDALGADFDLSNYAVDVPENARDIHIEDDDMDGVMTNSGSSNYYLSGSTPQFSHVVMSPENSPALRSSARLPTDSTAGPWANSLPTTASSLSFDNYSPPQPSPAFSSISAPSPQVQSLSHASQAGAATATSMMAAGSYRSQDPYAAGSMSAPAYKQSFDQSSLYPPALALQNLTSGPGPLRRFRSATPGAARTTDNIRRPSTATTAEQGLLSSAPTRAYHPYAITGSAAHYSSASGTSSTSSPAPFHMDLIQAVNGSNGNEQSHHQQQPRAMSRQSSSSQQSHSRSTPRPSTPS